MSRSSKMILRRHSQYGALGNMSVLRQMHEHASSPQTRGDAIDQCCELVIIVHVGIEVALLLNDDLSTAGAQADEIESEPRIERIAQGAEPLAKQTIDHFGFGDGLSGIDRDRADRAVGAKETGFHPPRAFALLRHRRYQHAGKPGQCPGYHSFGHHRFGETLLHDIIRQRLARADRRIALPQRLLEQCCETSAESCGDFMPRTVSYIADRFQPGAAQARDNSSIGAKRRYRQRLNRIGLFAIAYDTAMDMRVDVSGAHRSAGDSGADRKALRSQRVTNRPHHRGLAAE